jgi:CheY-like chemotaxis protein
MNRSTPATSRLTATAPLVLLVDGDDDTRAMYSDYLRNGAWRIDEAIDGREALAKAIANRPDVIVTETHLPGLDGYQLCGLLRKDQATATIPIVVVTGAGLAHDVARARAAGADLVMVKPCLPQTLAGEMRRLIDAAPDRRMAEAREGTTRATSRSWTKTAWAGEGRGPARGDTTTPPVAPPALLCPECDRPLIYRTSHIGGVSRRQLEQWDYYHCPGGCGAFQHRVRTRKLRKVL